jgi:hypothetical protein
MKSVRFLMSLLVAVMFPLSAWAHCDSLDGPVIVDARAALEKKDVTPMLKWVRPQDESLIREAFDRAVAVRQLGPEAKQLADTWFFETVVRIHRAGEGAPFTGLKPAGGILPPIQEADQALESGSVDKLAKTISEHTATGLRERFANAVKARSHASESPEAGREFIEAYVAYVHYVEGLVNVIHGEAHHEEGADRHP